MRGQVAGSSRFRTSAQCSPQLCQAQEGEPRKIKPCRVGGELRLRSGREPAGHGEESAAPAGPHGTAPRPRWALRDSSFARAKPSQLGIRADVVPSLIDRSPSFGRISPCRPGWVHPALPARRIPALGVRHKERWMVLQKAADASAGKFPASIIPPPPEVISAATTASGAREVRAWRPSLVDGQGTALEGLSIQPCDGALNVFAIAEFDKAEASWRPCHLVANHHRRGHLKACIGYKFAERRVGSVLG